MTFKEIRDYFLVAEEDAEKAAIKEIKLLETEDKKVEKVKEKGNAAEHKIRWRTCIPNENINV